MRRLAYRKNIRREIAHSLGRFLCIFLIAALGVAFLTGIRVCEPDMMKSADRLFDETNLMDLEVISTAGLTEDDVNALRGIEGVSEVMPAYSADMLEYTEGEQNVIKVMSVPTTLNTVKLLDGRMPQADNECLLDSKLTGFYAEYKIGDTITLTEGGKKSKDEDDEDEGSLRYDTFTITGIVTSPLYLDFGRGSSKLGSGSVLGYIIVPEGAFTQEFYSVVYLTGEGFSEELSYTDAYQDRVDALTDKVESIADARCEARLAELEAEVDKEINKARDELEDARKDADKELADARKELDDGYAELADAKKEYEDGLQKLADSEKELADGEKKIADGEAELADGENEIEENEQKLADAEKELADSKEKIDAGRAELDSNWAKYDDAKKELDSSYALLEDFRLRVTTSEAGLEGTLPYMTEEQKAQAYAELGYMKNLLAQSEQEYAAGLAQVEGFYAQLDNAESDYRKGLAEYEAGCEKTADAKMELEEGRRKLEDGRKELEDARRELEDGRKELEDGRRELEDAAQKIADAEKELADGEKEYQDGKKEAEEKLADGEKDIAEAEAEAYDKLPDPEWYVLDRGYVTSVSEFGLNANKIGAIGKVFPVIFFIVAILVCLTTMTRMVEEERTEIGTLKALGYSDFRVAWKFLLYCLLASVLGSAFGAVLGEYILPYCIINAYYILYNNIPYLEMGIDPGLSVAAGLITCACTLSATLLACAKSASEKAAELMRPVAPLPGKRVFMENIGFIWKRLNFTMKASVRNLLRYKKRFLMTVVGIGGCTALMLVGFGLHDSIFTIIDNQFFKVMVYDGVVSLNSSDEEAVDELVDYVKNSDVIAESRLMHQAATNAGANGIEKEAYIVVPSEVSDFEHYIYLGDRRSGTSYSLSDYPDGAVINEKLANLLNVKVGDTVYMTDENNARLDVKVAAITENYVYNYIYLVPSEYIRIFNEEPDYNVLYFNETEGSDEDDEAEFGREVLLMDAASGITYSSNSADSIYDMLSSLDFVVYVLVIAAALLAFVVLYNLSNININERRRELATLKVLGFYDGEVSAYMYRENIMLTIIGSLLGIVFGIFLHRFVILTAEVDMTLFGRQIKPLSYVYSLCLTYVFSAFVNWAMHFKLKKIDMVESLKSIE